jgi:hypothetical protein
MGTKPSNNFQSDRPESGGANHDEARENSGLLERAKQQFAQEQKSKHMGPPRPDEKQPGQTPAGDESNPEAAPRKTAARRRVTFEG